MYTIYLVILFLCCAISYCFGALQEYKNPKVIEVSEKDYIYRLRSFKMMLDTCKRTMEQYLTIEPFDDDKLVKMIEKFEYQINQIDFLLREQRK